MKRPAVPLFLSLCLFGSLGLAQPLLGQFERATTALERSVAAFPDDQVGSLDALRNAETAFGTLGAGLEPQLRQGLEAAFSRAEQALVNGSETDLAVQAAVLRGGFRRSVYEAALGAAADGQLERAQTLLAAVERDLGLSGPGVTGSSREALQTAFEARLAALALTRLDTPGDDLESRYRTLADLYSYVFLVQDSPRLLPETRTSVLNTIRALVEGRPVDDGFTLLRGQLERFLRNAEAAGGNAAGTVSNGQAAQNEPQTAQDVTATPTPTATPADVPVSVPASTSATPPVAPLPTVAAPADTGLENTALDNTALEAFPSVLGMPLPTLLRLAAGLLALVGLVQLLTTLARNPAPRQGAALALLLLPAVAEGLVTLAALLAAADLPLLAGFPLAQAGSFSLFINPTVQLVWAGLIAAAVLLLAGGQRTAPAPKGAVAQSRKVQRQAAPKAAVANETAALQSSQAIPQLAPAPSRAAASTIKWDDDF